ncbi:MAG: hypothetical protein ACLSUZ_00435 [Bifidobacterium pseudocatenulatum]
MPSAVASDGVDWRVDGMGVRDAWASGITGKGVKVAVLDNQIVSDYPALAGADVSYKLVTEGASPAIWKPVMVPFPPSRFPRMIQRSFRPVDT